MITTDGSMIMENGQYKKAEKLFGLSTDTKPTDVGNASRFIEIDTGKQYLFDATGSQWNEYSEGGGGRGGGGGAEAKQVNFIDYDGTILHAYTKEEANALAALPDNPTHDGLTAQGWNWTLAQIKAQIEELNAEITSLKDEVVTAQDETEATKEELAKSQKLVEQLKKLIQEMIARQAEGKGDRTNITSLPAGEKGKIIQADNENMFAIVEFTDATMKELKGDNLDRPIPIIELGVKRPGFNGAAGEFVGRIRLRQEVKDKNYVICDILKSWEQDKIAADDVIFAD